MLILKPLCLLAFCFAALTNSAAAGQLPLPAATVSDPAALANAMSALAQSQLSTYKESDRRAYLDNLFRIQLVAGRYSEALSTLSSLHDLRGNATALDAATNRQYEIYARAKIAQIKDGVSFETAFEQEFRQTFATLDDKTSSALVRAFEVFQAGMHDDLRSALTRTDALALLRAYQVDSAYRAFTPIVEPLVAEDDARRYVIENDIPLKMPDGGIVCTFVMRSRSLAPKSPALLQYTIYADRATGLDELRRTASNGYVSVEALTRGKGCSPDATEPYVHDGSDAAMVIDWISRQSWSDGRVGMYGGSYNSFVQWSVAKRLPPALKALMPSVSNAPGIDTPMERNIFETWVYEWPLYVTSGKWLDATGEGDQTRWVNMEKKWYLTGKPYRALDKIDGTPNPIWDNWLTHPSYDAFWQRLIPYKQEFARINIPVLMTDGYLAGQSSGGLYYFSQYSKYNPRAQSYLVIGPYDHLRGQHGTMTRLGGHYTQVAGFQIDAAAQIDIPELRYKWFDYIFKGGSIPTILQDRVNYEVMGGNVWKHAPSLDAMHKRMLRYYLTSSRSGKLNALANQKPRGVAFVPLVVNLADRSDLNRIPPPGLDTYLSVAFRSAPLENSFDLSGLFAGHLDFVTNRRDFDFNVSLYRLTSKGEYIGITYYQARASYVRDGTHRHLLAPGKRTRLDFIGSRLTSWQLHAGDRLVVTISIPKPLDGQINYGSGKDVSDETIADAKVPLEIKWYTGSFVDIPSSE